MTSNSDHSTKVIIQYWDNAGLCSFESSTSNADPDLAYFDNFFENKNISKLLSELNQSYINALDIGAGYGRFTNTLKPFFENIWLLEGSKNLYEKLCMIWGNEEKIKCIHSDFEHFSTESKFDLIIASGVLYLYNEEMVNSFLEKVSSLLNNQGLFIIRDFVRGDKNQTLKSSYIKNGFCYYRTPDFWADSLKQHNLTLKSIIKSKPSVSLLRNKRIQKLLRLINLSWFIRDTHFIQWVDKNSQYKLNNNSINTVFIYANKTGDSL